MAEDNEWYQGEVMDRGLLSGYFCKGQAQQ